jgi:HEAT repeat protein
VQKAVIQALKSCPGDAVVGPMLPLLRDSDAAVRANAAQVLEFLGWRPGDRSDEMWFWAAKGQLARMVGLGVAAIPVIENVLRSSPYGLCVAGLNTLGEIGGPGIVAAVLPCLRSAEAAVCASAAEALGKSGALQAVEPLLGMLAHPNAQVRTAAIEALGALRASQAVEVLEPFLKDPVWEVRRAAVETLGKLADPRAVDILARTLHDGDPDVRETSATSLGRLGDRRAIGPLVLSLKDSTSAVRRVAVGALTRIDKDWASSVEARDAFEQLKSALQADDSEVRHFVGQILESVGASPALPSLSTAPMMPMSFVSESVPQEFLEGRRKLAVSLLLAILCDADPDLRQSAALALGQLGDQRAEVALNRALSDADPAVGLEAQRSLYLLANQPLPESQGNANLARIAEMLLCSGTGEILFESGCDSENRALLLRQIEQQSSQLAALAPMGAFDRLEIMAQQGRIICQVQPDRQIFVRSVRPNWGAA